MNRRLHCLFVVLLCLLHKENKAQGIPKHHYTADNGLPSNMVYSVYRSSNGFLWFATNKGIAVYNGLKFDKYTTFNGLPDNEVFGFQEDRKGRLWLATYNGELCYYQDGIFHTAENTPFLRLPVKISYIKDIMLEEDGSVTISFGENTKFINIKDEHCVMYNVGKIKDSMQHVIIKKKLQNGYYLLVYAAGTLEVDSLGNIIHIESRDYSRYKNRQAREWARTKVQDQHFVFNEFCIYNRDLQVIRRLPENVFEKDIRQIYTNKEGFFFCTKGGLILNDSVRLIEGNGSCITQDGADNYWFTTLDNGVYLFSGDFLKTKYYDNAYKGTVSYVYSDKKNILFVPENKNVYQLGHNAIKPLLFYDQYKIPEQRITKTSGYLIDTSYRFFFCNNNGLVTVNDLFAKHKKIDKCPALTGSPYVFTKIIKDSSTLYFNSRHMILSAGYQKWKGNRYMTLNKLCDSEQRFFAMAQRRDGSIWCNSIGNMYKVVDGKLVPQPQFAALQLKLFDFYGNYLVGYTHRNQLVVCSDIDSKIVKVDSIPMQNCIWDKFFKVDSSHVLISTDNLYRLLTLEKDKFSGRYPMQAIENKFIPTDAENVCMDDLNCYFFKNGAITSIDKQSLFKRPAPPSVYFTLIRSGKWYHAVRNYIKIAYGESRNIKILFSAISYSGKELAYKYSVSKGPKDNWVDLSGDEINLTNASYGNYTVKLTAKTISSHYSDPIVFRMTILRPYWATRWFIVLAVVVGGAFVWAVGRFIFLYSIKKRERKYKNEMKFLKSEYKALNALMNPHFIFNTLNNVQSLVNNNDKKTANEYLRIFADLIRQNMHNISKELISLQREMALVNNYLLLEQLRFEDKLNYNIVIDDGVDISDVMIPPLLIQPLVENSIKHGILPSAREGTIKIHIYQQRGKLYIEVRDNGIGIKVLAPAGSGKHESYGLRNIEKRIEQLGAIQNKKIEMSIGEKDDEEDDAPWTVVTISLPID